MWKLFLLSFSVIAIKSSFEAHLYCSSFSAAQECTFDHIDSVLSSNDTIDVINQPATYIDTSLTAITLDFLSVFIYFPYNILKTFPNADNLMMTGNGLVSAITNTFGTCAKLTSIIIDSEQFTNLPYGFAQNCVLLQTLKFMNSELTTLDPNGLLGLTNLQALYIDTCKIKCIPLGFFANTPNIVNIYLINNMIGAIDGSLFKGLPRLTSLYLTSNMIPYIPSMDLTGTSTQPTDYPQTRLYIYLTDNPITAAYPQVLEGMFQGRSTYMQFNAGPDVSYPLATCFPQNMPNTDNNNYTTNKANYYTNCINNWTPAMASAVVNCNLPTTTTTTTLPPTSSTTTTLSPTTTTIPPVTQPPTPIPTVTQPPTIVPTVPTVITPLPPQTTPSCAPPCPPPCQKSIMDIIVKEAHNFSVRFN